MEAIGKVNQYEIYKGPAGKRVFTLNIACGVTPFMIHVDGVEYSSNCYRVTREIVTVTKVWYRPASEEFSELNTGIQDHVLNGGLLLGADLKKQTLANDPTTISTSYEEFQAFCLRIYGRRRK